MRVLSKQQHHRLQGSSTEGFSTTRFNVPYSGARDAVAFVEGLSPSVLGFLEEAFDSLLSERSFLSELLPSEGGGTFFFSASLPFSGFDFCLSSYSFSF